MIPVTPWSARDPRSPRAHVAWADRGARSDPAIELDADPAVATYQMGALGPFEVLDRHRLLATTTPEARRDLLVDLIAGANELLGL